MHSFLILPGLWVKPVRLSYSFPLGQKFERALVRTSRTEAARYRCVTIAVSVSNESREVTVQLENSSSMNSRWLWITFSTYFAVALEWAYYWSGVAQLSSNSKKSIVRLTDRTDLFVNKTRAKLWVNLFLRRVDWSHARSLEYFPFAVLLSHTRPSRWSVVVWGARCWSAAVMCMSWAVGHGSSSGCVVLLLLPAAHSSPNR